MSTVEKDKCNFCNEVKPVLRKYVNSKIGDTFVIVRYCKECGIEDNDPREDVIKYLKAKRWAIIVDGAYYCRKHKLKNCHECFEQL